MGRRTVSGASEGADVLHHTLRHRSCRTNVWRCNSRLNTKRMGYGQIGRAGRAGRAGCQSGDVVIPSVYAASFWEYDCGVRVAALCGRTQSRKVGEVHKILAAAKNDIIQAVR